jgi:sec-independent protein translocase protein TatC
MLVKLVKAAAAKRKNRRPLTDDAQMELVEHLGELRGRLFRAIIYVVLAAAVSYNFFREFLELLKYPVRHLAIPLLLTGIQEAFLLKLQVSFLAGLAVASPFIIMEVWGFVAPALTSHERRPVLFLAPFSVLLFLAGVGTAYAALPATYGWMIGFTKDFPDAQFLQEAKQYILLTVKILAASGIAFQLPIVLLFLARIGVINDKTMIQYWRHAIVGIAAAAAILTPSQDPLTMLMMTIPMAGLYGLSIILVRAFEPKEDGTRSLSFATMLVVALAPLGILAAVSYFLWRGAHANAAATPPPPAAVAPRTGGASAAASSRS